ncbi:flagellar hook assembly protein FlgD [Nitrincola sp. MINF-07-Sa-05]|uniref:flagellar hook assembly protein FlgD n=1 Tax=Nitrincola salilacus TaxID=3400273 RepID=UPI0039183AD0
MSTINGTGQNVFDKINQNNQSEAQKAKGPGDESQMFMKLMIAQLQNQDPTSPAETTDFMQQISSMTMVESMANMSNTVESMSNSLLSSQAALQASAMVGRNAYVKTDTGILTEDRAVRGMVPLETSVSDLKVSVYDGAGNLIDAVNMGNQSAGEHNFAWAGLDMPPGKYRFVAEARQGDGEYQTVESYIAHTVNSVTLGQNGIGMKVNTDGGSVGINDVRQIG